MILLEFFYDMGENEWFYYIKVHIFIISKKILHCKNAYYGKKIFWMTAQSILRTVRSRKTVFYLC